MTCASNEFEDILSWYQQFSRSGPVDWTVPGDNVFWKVQADEIVQCERTTGIRFPQQYRDFLLLVGEGRFGLGRNAISEDTYANIFLGPRDIEGILTKKSDCWSIYPDEFIYPGDFPFFDTGSCEVMVFRQSDNCPCFPGDVIPVSNSFEAFLMSLRENPRFYILPA